MHNVFSQCSDNCRVFIPLQSKAPVQERHRKEVWEKYESLLLSALWLFYFLFSLLMCDFSQNIALSFSLPALFLNFGS